MVVVVEGLMSMEEVVEEVQHFPQLDQWQQKVLKVSVLFSFL